MVSASAASRIAQTLQADRRAPSQLPGGEAAQARASVGLQRHAQFVEGPSWLRGCAPTSEPLAKTCPVKIGPNWRSAHGLLTTALAARARKGLMCRSPWTSRSAQSTTTSTLWCCSRVTLTSCQRWSGPLRPALSARQPHGQPEGVDCRRSPTSSGNTAFAVTTTTKPTIPSTTDRGCAPPLGLLWLPPILPAVHHRPSVVHWRGFFLQTTEPAVPSAAGRGYAGRCSGCWGCRRSCPLSAVACRWCADGAFSQTGGTKRAGGPAGRGRSTRRRCVWVSARTRGGGLGGRPGPGPSRAERRRLRRSPAGGLAAVSAEAAARAGSAPSGAEAGRVAAASRRVAGPGRPRRSGTGASRTCRRTRTWRSPRCPTFPPFRPRRPLRPRRRSSTGQKMLLDAGCADARRRPGQRPSVTRLYRGWRRLRRGCAVDRHAPPVGWRLWRWCSPRPVLGRGLLRRKAETEAGRVSDALARVPALRDAGLGGGS